MKKNRHWNGLIWDLVADVLKLQVTQTNFSLDEILDLSAKNLLMKIMMTFIKKRKMRTEKVNEVKIGLHG